MKIFAVSLTIFLMFISIIVLDTIWLGNLTKKFIIHQFGSLVVVKDGNIQIKLLVGIITWLVIAVGVYIFAVNTSGSLAKAALMGAVFGLISYAIYDLTNLTFIKDYPIRFVFVDVAWGTVLCSILSIIGYFFRGFLLK